MGLLSKSPLTLALLSTLACSGSSTPDTGTPDTGADAGLTQDLGTPDSGTPDAGPLPCTDGTFIERIQGNIQTQQGTPLEGAFAQMCLRTADSFLCLSPEMSDTRGRYSVEIPVETRCLQQVTLRSLVPNEPRATSYCLIDIDGAPNELMVSDPIRLFDTTAATTVPPPGDTAQERTVVFADGMEMDIVPDSFFGAYDQLSSAQIPPDSEGICFLPPNHNTARLWGFYPEGNIIRGAVPIRIPNDLGLTAGQTAPLFVLGGLSCELADGTLLEEGEWHEYGVGTVSADGTTIEGELPCLNWFGIGMP